MIAHNLEAKPLLLALIKYDWLGCDIDYSIYSPSKKSTLLFQRSQNYYLGSVYKLLNLP